MASGERLRGILECSICLEPFKNPKCLPCIHTFCLDCLVRHAANAPKITCPICRKQFDTPAGGFANLPNNFLLNDILEGSTSESSTGGPKCELCADLDSMGGGGPPAAMYCMDCAQALCEPCSRRHEKVKKTSGDRVVSMREWERQRATNESRGRYCAKHGDEILEVYCYECKRALCALCCAMEHAEHDYCQLGESTSQPHGDKPVAASAVLHQHRDDKNVKPPKHKRIWDKERLTKDEIGLPTNFRHVGHIGWDPDRGFEVGNLHPALKTFFDAAHVKEAQLTDKKTAAFINRFIVRHGGLEAVIEDQKLRAAQQGGNRETTSSTAVAREEGDGGRSGIVVSSRVQEISEQFASSQGDQSRSRGSQSVDALQVESPEQAPNRNTLQGRPAGLPPWVEYSDSRHTRTSPREAVCETISETLHRSLLQNMQLEESSQSEEAASTQSDSGRNM